MGRDEKKEREGRKVFPATTLASKDTPKEERRRVPSYDKSIQGHPRKKEGGEGKEKERERERKGEERKGKAGVPSYEESSRDTPKKERGDPESSIRENHQKARKEREGKEKQGD